MKLSCPSCSQEFPPEDVNVEADVAYCRKCVEGFAISALVGSRPGGPERAERPEGTKVRFARDRWSLAAVLPKATPRGFGCFMLVFTVFWNGITWGVIISEWSGRPGRSADWFGMLFMVPFVIAGLVTFGLALYGLFGKCSFAMNDSEILIAYKVLAFRFRRRFRAADLERVALAEGFKQNDSPVMGVGLFMKNRSRPVVFGTGLSDGEKRWLVWEIHDFRRELPPAEPDTPGGLVRGERPADGDVGGHYLR